MDERVTRMTIMTYPEQNDAAQWSVAEAKAKFSEVVERARTEQPQTISKHGRPVAVVVSADEWERKTKRVGSLVDFFRRSPLADAPLELKRTTDRPRKITV